MKHIMNPWDNGVIIRSWDEEDGPEMADLHRRAILATSDEFYTQAQRESWAHGLDGKGYATRAKRGEQFIIAVDEDDKPLAFCGYKDNEICGLYVDPDHQGRGIGQRLALRAIANLLQSQPEKLVVDSSAPSVSFYEALGYQITRKVTHDTRGGKKLHAFDMETDPIEYSAEIGPHEGRELELMLAGNKQIAWFAEMDPIDAFAPYVEDGKIHRYEWRDWTKHFYEQMKDQLPPNTPWPEPAVYFMPGAEDRVDQLLDAVAATYARTESGYDLALEREIGELLDYPTHSIDVFIEEMQRRSAKGEVPILDN